MPKESKPQNLFIKKSLTRHLGSGIQTASDHSENSRTSTPTVSEDEGGRGNSETQGGTGAVSVGGDRSAIRTPPTTSSRVSSGARGDDNVGKQRELVGSSHGNEKKIGASNKQIKDGKEDSKTKLVGEEAVHDERASRILVDKFQEALNDSADESSSVSTSSESREHKSSKRRSTVNRKDYSGRGGYHSSYRGGYRGGGKSDRNRDPGRMYHFPRGPRPMVTFGHGPVRPPPPPPSSYMDQLSQSPRDTSQYMGHITSPHRTPRHSESSSCGSPLPLHYPAQTPPQSPRRFYESPISSPLRRHTSPFNSPPRHPASPLPRMLPPEVMHPGMMQPVPIPQQEMGMFHGGTPPHYNHPHQMRPMTHEQQHMLFSMEQNFAEQQQQQQLAYQYQMSKQDQAAAEFLAKQRAQQGQGQSLPMAIQHSPYYMQYLAQQQQQQGFLSIGQRHIVPTAGQQMQVLQQVPVGQQSQGGQPMQFGQQMQIRQQLSFGQQIPIGTQIQVGQQMSPSQHIQEEQMNLGQRLSLSQGIPLGQGIQLGQGMPMGQGMPTGQGIPGQMIPGGQGMVSQGIPQAALIMNASSPGGSEISPHLMQQHAQMGQMRQIMQNQIMQNQQLQAGFVPGQQMPMSGYQLQNSQMQQMQMIAEQCNQPIIVPQPIHPEIGNIGHSLENTVPIQNMTISSASAPPNVVPPNGNNATIHPYSFVHPEALQQQQQLAHVQTIASPALPLEVPDGNMSATVIPTAHGIDHPILPETSIPSDVSAPTTLNTGQLEDNNSPVPPVSPVQFNENALSIQPEPEIKDTESAETVHVETNAPKIQPASEKPVDIPTKTAAPETQTKQSNKTPGLIRLPPQLPTEEELMKSPDAYTPANMKKNYWQNRQKSSESEKLPDVDTGGQKRDVKIKNSIETADKEFDSNKDKKEKTKAPTSKQSSETQKAESVETPKKSKAHIKSKAFNLNDLGDLLSSTVKHNKTLPKTDISSTSGNVEVFLNQGIRRTQSPNPAAARAEPPSSRGEDNWRPLSRESKAKGEPSWRSTDNAASAKSVLDEDPARDEALKEAQSKDLSTGQQIQYAIEKLKNSSSPAVRSVSESSSKSTKAEVEESEVAPWYDEEDEDDINPFDVTM